ncbi:MAG TPA: ABC transporter permease [Chitinophagaceae bacterium]|nr:ABC transporter permease [Chitinophagaceae bacterium]MCC6633929.1 ABC transporter permease [Chitinophagaceae bacterium]HMZ46639.1 ABC transporter permease [Chitinophagaceae bacterium]HNE92706.1 ABC transporter permease [Chitinophagaceae bacterium]HNF29827.1 ABC transporter permease [Chitinophagaceae bacterium]
MNKILIIARREFLSRVQKKTFLLTTIGLPILIFGIYALIIYFAVKTTDNFTIAIADEANIFEGKLAKKNDGEINFIHVQNETPETLKKQIEAKKINAFVFIPKTFDITGSTDSIQVISDKSVGLITREKIIGKLNNVIEEKKMLGSLHITKTQLDSLQKTNEIVFTTTKGVEDTSKKAGISYGVGFVSGFLIYIILFIYGTMVMRGVMEEKTNRIAEVIVSSVKPFQLMMGKIFGIGSVGLVQFLIWIILIIGLQFLLPIIFPDMLTQMQAQPMQPGIGAAASTMSQENTAMVGIMNGIGQVNWLLIVGCFLFYFLGGYFLYSSLFAAVGSTVNEDPQDAQSLMLPITMPIIFGMVIMMKAVNDPNSSLAIFGSIFPLTSPIVMMARIAHGVPEGVSILQLLISMACLIVGFVATTWLAGKIYRTGILMYGKKVNWKTIGSWILRKN